VIRLARVQDALNARRADEQAALDKFREQAARLAAAQKAQAGFARDNAPSPASASGGLICPVLGPVSFVDSWHAAREVVGRTKASTSWPRGHAQRRRGLGSVTMKSGGISGNGVHLQGDNGGLYYYFHLGAQRAARDRSPKAM
jgi:hypothetical protein